MTTGQHTMPKALRNIPNIPASRTQGFQVFVASRARYVSGTSPSGRPMLYRPIEFRAHRLAKEFGGGETSSDFNFATDTREISFSFSTHIDALAFTDAVKELKSLSVQGISYVSEKADLYVQLSPTKKLLSAQPSWGSRP